MIEQIKQALHKATHGAEWTNFDGRDQSKVVYEYDRLTEDTCAIIAECQTVEMAQFIADCPEWLRYLIGEVERLDIAAHIDMSLGNTVAEMHGEIEELKKALEWYAQGEKAFWEVYETQNDGGERARQTLQSIQGGNTP
jgi:hypothetical protein